jgi:2-hydroxy-3-oxopropionate reductase
MKQRIGFIGVGLMGSQMARNLIAAGFSVTAHDLDPAKVDAIVQAGGRKAAAPDQIPPQVDVIIMSLPNSQNVTDAVAAMRLLETGRPGLIVLDASTIDMEVSADLVGRLRAKGIEMLDATVSGTPEMCAAKDNIFMVGGKKEAFDQCEAVFAAMSREALLVGPNGSGLTIKLVVNLMMALNRMALAEALTLAKRAGLDQLQTLEILKKSAAYSKAMDQKGYRMVHKQFVPATGRLHNTIKSLRLVLALGTKLNCPLPLLSLNVQALASEIAKGRGEWDSSDIISFYSELANV